MCVVGLQHFNLAELQNECDRSFKQPTSKVCLQQIPTS